MITIAETMNKMSFLGYISKRRASNNGGIPLLFKVDVLREIAILKHLS